MELEPSEDEATWDDWDQTLRLSGFTKGAFFQERYRIESLIAQGAMGKVFRCVDIAEDRPVALKVLHREMAKKQTVLDRFRREAEILDELGHEGIVRVFDHGRSPEGIDYLVMELLEGRTLSERVARDGPLTPEALLPLLIQICDALGAAHEQGVVHRDLKPDNIILIDDDERVKVVDFGLSRLATEKRMTKTGVMLGTPRYMPPEQIRSAKDADARTDQYALGVMTHEALTGSSPFPAGDPGQLLGCVIEGRILTLEEERPELSEELGAVVRRAMSKDRKDRFATIGAFVEAFAGAIGRRTGRSMLAEGGMSDLFALADQADASGEIELPDRIASTPSFELPRFTQPPAVEAPASAQSPMASPPAAGTKSTRGLAFFLVALLVVVCLSSAVALGIRAWLRGGLGIATPVIRVCTP